MPTHGKRCVRHGCWQRRVWRQSELILILLGDKLDTVRRAVVASTLRKRSQLSVTQRRNLCRQ